MAGPLVALITIASCNATGPSPQPRVECRADAASCQEAVRVALDNAPVAIGTPTQLIVTTGSLPDCRDPRPVVCPWNVRLISGEGNETFSRDQLVVKAPSGEWLPMQVVTMTPEPSRAQQSGYGGSAGSLQVQIPTAVHTRVSWLDPLASRSGDR